MSAIRTYDSLGRLVSVTGTVTGQPSEERCLRGGWHMGIGMDGRLVASPVDCKSWSCPPCGKNKRTDATTEGRYCLRRAGVVYLLVFDEADAYILERVQDRARRLRKKLSATADTREYVSEDDEYIPLPVSEYFWVHSGDRYLLVASQNFGNRSSGGPYPSDFVAFRGTEAEYQAMLDPWFEAVDGEVPVKRTDGSTAWTQKAHRVQRIPRGGNFWSVGKARNTDCKDEHYRAWAALMRSRCPSPQCSHQDDTHGLNQDESVRLAEEAARIVNLRDDPWGEHPDDPAIRLSFHPVVTHSE